MRLRQIEDRLARVVELRGQPDLAARVGCRAGRGRTRTSRRRSASPTSGRSPSCDRAAARGRSPRRRSATRAGRRRGRAPRGSRRSPGRRRAAGTRDPSRSSAARRAERQHVRRHVAGAARCRPRAPRARAPARRPRPRPFSMCGEPTRIAALGAAGARRRRSAASAARRRTRARASRTRSASSCSASARVPIGDQLRAERAVDVARQIVDAVVADRDAEVLRRDVLELVRLVDDRVAAARDHFAVLALAHGRVGAQQVMVDDHDVGFGGALAHARDEAVLVAAGIRCRCSSRCVAAMSFQNGRSSGRSSSSARSPVSVSRRQSSIRRT